MQKDTNVREQMFSLIASWQQSGLTQKSYCAQHAIGYHVFHYWYKCFRSSQLPAKEQRFISLKIQPSPDVNTSLAYAELLLPDGKRILFYTPVASDYLKAIIS